MPGKKRPKVSRKTAVKSRPVAEGHGRWFEIRNREPGMKYSLPYTGDDSVEEHLEAGWTPVLWQVDGKGKVTGPHVRTGRAADRVDGAEITARDHLLMQIPEKRWYEIQQYGPYGDTGQALADQREAHIRRLDKSMTKDLGGFITPKAGDWEGDADSVFYDAET